MHLQPAHVIFFKEQTLLLSPLRAAYWVQQQMLIIADLHLGKTAYFRNSGIAIPHTVMQDDLKRLSFLIETYQPEQVVVAGDMFHKNVNADIHVFQQWRQAYPHLQFSLVPGNHDTLLAINYTTLGVVVKPPVWLTGPFSIVHEKKEEMKDYFSISGHWHPGCVMQGKARQVLRFPCFIASARGVILPAFSAFTGLYTKYAKDIGNTYYAITSHTSLLKI